MRSVTGSFLDPSSCIVIKAQISLQDIYEPTAGNIANIPEVHKVIATVRKRAIQAGLEQASIEELKERLAILEQSHPELVDHQPPTNPAPRSRL